MWPERHHLGPTNPVGPSADFVVALKTSFSPKSLKSKKATPASEECDSGVRRPSSAPECGASALRGELLELGVPSLEGTAGRKSKLQHHPLEFRCESRSRFHVSTYFKNLTLHHPKNTHKKCGAGCPGAVLMALCGYIVLAPQCQCHPSVFRL